MKRISLGFFVSVVLTSLVLGFQASSVKASTTYPSGLLVNDKGTIYLIRGTEKVPFTNWQSFIGLGYSLQNVVQGDTSGYTVAANYVVTPNAAHPWGSWVSYNGTVYYSTSSGLIGVATPAIFMSNGGEWSYIVPANKLDIANIQANALLAIGDSRVYQNKPSATTSASNVCEYPTPPSGYHYEGGQPYPTCGATLVPNNTVPSITEPLTPVSGSAGTQVTITGSGFTPTGNDIVVNGLGWVTGLPATNNGTSLTFTVPNSVDAYCPATTISGTPTACPEYSEPLNSGTYSLTVVNANGTSNAATFTVISSDTSSDGVCEYPAPPNGFHYEGGQPYPTCGATLVKNSTAS
jgi:hypothetical protein